MGNPANRSLLRVARQGIVGHVDVTRGPVELSERDRALIDFERSWWTSADITTKAGAIRTELGLAPSTYYGALEQLIDSKSAQDYDPLVIRRLRRRRRERRRMRIDGYESRRSHPH